jgi:hypothetical protein
MFDRYLGIDYSGAATPITSLKGLRVYQADLASSPREVPPPPNPKKYWTRRGLAAWLVDQLNEPVPPIEHSGPEAGPIPVTSNLTPEQAYFRLLRGGQG